MNFRNLKLRNSLFSLKGYNPIIPNELKKYFNDKIVDNSYLKKLSILLHSNDKNYDKKRLDINNLTNVFDINNGEYLTKLKFNYNSDINNSLENEKTINNPNFNLENSINYSLNYIREPKVIINNEKLMKKFFKKKSKLDKLPYLSLSTNDLINNNYKKQKNISNNIHNCVSKNNNYLNSLSKNKKIRLKKIHISSFRNKLNDKKDLKSSFTVKSIDEKKHSNNLLFDNKINQQNEQKEETINFPPKSNDKSINNKLKDEEDANYIEKFNKLKKLSNKDVIQKIEDSIEIKGIEKKLIPKYLNCEYESKIDFKFGNHFPYLKRNILTNNNYKYINYLFIN